MNAFLAMPRQRNPANIHKIACIHFDVTDSSEQIMPRSQHPDAGKPKKLSVSATHGVKKDKIISTKKKTDKGVVERTSPAYEFKFKGLTAIRDGTLHRLMQKGGILHISRTAYLPFRTILYALDDVLVKKAYIFASNMGRKTISPEDVRRALDVLDWQFFGKINDGEK